MCQFSIDAAAILCVVSILKSTALLFNRRFHIINLQSLLSPLKTFYFLLTVNRKTKLILIIASDPLNISNTYVHSFILSSSQKKIQNKTLLNLQLINNISD
jgi:hypothetical protein